MLNPAVPGKMHWTHDQDRLSAWARPVAKYAREIVSRRGARSVTLSRGGRQ